MVNLLPAVLVGGPPHAGKSVLFYQLTHALRERRIAHHAIRACPDGEGNWFQEGDPELVSTIRIKLSGEWPDTFVQQICQNLEHRCLPFLVDMGGAPKPSQERLLRLCTHAILLVRPDKPEAAQHWERLVTENNLLPLARLSSERTGDSVITTRLPILEGTITGLERHATQTSAGPLFDELVERVAALFGSYDLRDRRKMLLDQAPTELVLDLTEALRTFTSTSTRWEPAMLPSLLASLPAQTPLSVYEAGPGWLYTALAAYTDPQPFYLFDPKLPFGWVQPARVSLGPNQSSQIRIESRIDEEATLLTIIFPDDRLDYLQLDPLSFPPMPTEKGLIINGRAPNWLLTALVRLYKASGVPWIAPFYVPLNCAIVVYSGVEQYQPGDLVSVS